MGTGGGAGGGFRGGRIMGAERAKVLAPKAQSEAIKGFRIGQFTRPDGTKARGLIITGKDGTRMGFSFRTARGRLTGFEGNKAVVTPDGAKKMILTPAQGGRIAQLLQSQGGGL